MPESALIVDPLAALFRPELKGLPPLVLDTTHVEVMPLPPLAHIVVVRKFTNSSNQLVEAVLTLPPLAPQEVVYRLIVNIGGVDYQANPQSSKRARPAHDAAVAEGRSAILYELLDGGIQMISIAGIEPGARVEIQIWSIRPLDRPEENRATLLIPLSAHRHAAIFSLPDADALVTTAERHAASLSVSAEPSTLQVMLTGQPYPDQQLTSNEDKGVECSTPIFLHFIPINGRTLDRCEWQVGEPGGWEVTSKRGIETFRHPMNPTGSVSSDRNDWIFGVMQTVAGEIRVTAPLPTEGIAPNARALRAFAAAGLVESARPQNPAAVRLMANVLSRQTSLAFIGPEGELSDEIPMLRKLALAEMESIDFGREPQIPVALPPFEYNTPSAPEPALPSKDGEPILPRARQPRYHWLTWGFVVLALLLIAALFQSIDLPVLPALIAFVCLMLLSAIRFLPREGLPARRRLPITAVLVLPWIASFFGGPLVWQFIYGEMPTIADWMIPFQYGLLALAALLPIVLLPIMRDARRFTLVFGLLNLVLTFFMTSTSIVTLSPGS